MAYLNVDESSLSKIYNFSPAFSNLYTLELYPLKDNLDEDIINIFRYHSSKVDMDGESITMKRNDVTKRFQLEGSAYKRTDTVSITLREDEKWSVKRYHEKWLSQFYDKNGDFYVSHDVNSDDYLNLYRKLRIFLPNTNECVSMIILPTNTGGLGLGWGSGSIITHSLTYNVESWKWETLNVGNTGISSGIDVVRSARD